MSSPKESRGVLESLKVAAGFAGLTMGYSVAALPAILADPDRGAPRVARRWATRCLALAGVEVEIEGAEGLHVYPGELHDYHFLQESYPAQLEWHIETLSEILARRR